MARFAVPTWVPASLELDELAARKTFDAARGAQGQLFAAVKLLEASDADGNVDAGYEAAQTILEAAQRLVEFLRPAIAPAPKPAAATVGSLDRDPRYLAAYYYVARHKPADLRDVKYRDCKTDPRIVELWAQGEALWDAGKITVSGVAK